MTGQQKPNRQMGLEKTNPNTEAITEEIAIATEAGPIKASATCTTADRDGWRKSFVEARSKTLKRRLTQMNSHDRYERLCARFGITLTVLMLIGFTLFVTSAASAKTIKVNSRSDVMGLDGVVTLREAITAANTNAPSGDAPKGDPGLDTIVFDIPGPNGFVQTINLTSPLPAITEALKIDGYTQPGASANTLAVGNNGVLLIELNGTGAGVNASGLNITTSGCTIRGLIINRFGQYGIFLNTGGASLIAGNFIGTNSAGTAAFPVPNNDAGVYVNSGNNIIGGANPADRNLISGNAGQAGGTGVDLDLSFANNNKIIGNYIGTDASGTAALTNATNGVYIDGCNSNMIGGTTPGERNLISGNFNFGVGFGNTASSNNVRGNYIGTKADGVTALGNGIGISFAHTSHSNTIGGALAGAGNIIAFSTLVGVEVSSQATSNAILGNAIFANGTVANFLGIELYTNNFGPTPNDKGDSDVGANNLQNFPVLTSVIVNGATTTIQGTLDSAANKQFRVEFFSNKACDSTLYGEGEKFVGFVNVTTDASGIASFTSTVPTASLSGNNFAATATDPNSNTSEFSLCKQAEAGSFAFSSATYSANEKGGGISITVVRNGASTGAVSIDYAASNGTADAGFDYKVVSGSLQFGDGVTSQTFNVPLIDDSFYEGNETIKLSLSGPDGGATLGNPNTAVVTIVDDETQPTISINDVSIAEGNSGTINADFTVNLSNASFEQISVSYATTAGGTATAGNDYQPTNGILVFAPGQTDKKVTVIVNGDTQEEPDETFMVQLGSPANATLAKSQGTGTIINDDAAKSGALEFSSASYNVTENGGSTLITVKRTGGSSGAVSAQYSTIAGSATDGSDYAANSGSLNWADGDATDKTFTVSVIDDPINEASETINLNLSNATGGASLGNQSSAVLTVADDDALPAFSISDASQAEGQSGTATFSFDVTLSAASEQTITVDYLTGNGSAVAGVDYQAGAGTLTFLPGEKSKSISIPVNGDTDLESDETFLVNLSNAANATVAKAQGTGTIVDDDTNSSPTIQFSQATYSAVEQLGAMTVTVVRSGDASGAAAVDYETSDGSATQKGDFEYAAGTLNFGPGEVSKTIVVLLNQDSHSEGPEGFSLLLKNPAGAAVGAQGVAQAMVSDDLSEPASNPIDDAQTFVHMHYHDFLNREPDATGLAFWTNEITSCGNDAQCTDAKRAIVSAAFFLSIEFQETGYLRYLLQKESFGSTPRYVEFMRDVQEVSRGVIVNSPGWEQKLKDNQREFAEKWTSRPEFKSTYDSMSNADYVNALYTNAGILPTPAERDSLVNALDTSSENRAAILLDVAENVSFRQKESSAAFVMMQYFGYLRRDPDAAPDSDLSGYNFWLNKLNAFNGDFQQAEMVKAFITSFEYRGRFAQ